MTRTVALTAASVVAMAALAGCTSEDDPPETPTPTPTSASPSPTVSPSPSPTETSPIPAAAREKTEAGAKAFARFYIEQSAVAWTEPDPELIRGLATADCSTCANLLSKAEELVSKKQRYSDDPVKVVSLTRFRGGAEEWVFDSELQEQAVSVVDAAGSVVSKSPARKLNPAIAVVWREGHWWIDAIGD